MSYKANACVLMNLLLNTSITLIVNLIQVLGFCHLFIPPTSRSPFPIQRQSPNSSKQWTPSQVRSPYLTVQTVESSTSSLTHSITEVISSNQETFIPNENSTPCQDRNNSQVDEIEHIEKSVRIKAMTTRSMNNILRPKNLFLEKKHPISKHIEPTSASIAVRDENWKRAMHDELQTLEKNCTRDLVEVSKNRSIIGYKWIFCIKKNSDGSTARWKARLVAKGFNQRPRVDYRDSFSHVVKLVTVWVVMTLAMTHDWSISQLDVNNAFLQGDLIEEVYMKQPYVLYDKKRPLHVCKLKKAIYDLK